jgi:hypothetical protein
VSAPLFPLGRVVATPGALSALTEASVEPLALLRRHVSGDWGEVPDCDARENEKSLRRGWRLLSSYPIGENGAKVWILTEATREATTILLPSEY